MNYPSEAQEQVAIIQYCDLKRIPIFHIANGGSRNTIEAVNLKRQGVRSGVPDLCMPLARKGYHGLYIELKVGKNKPSANQLKWIETLNINGYKAVVCYGFDETIKTIEDYLKENNG